jgi:hypothetical protein
MHIYHQELANGKWDELSFMEQMANIGSEVSRALNWVEKGKIKFSRRALYRALELIELTLNSLCRLKKYSKLKEITRLRELLIDFFIGDNEYHSTVESWRKYFHNFNFAARNL